MKRVGDETELLSNGIITKRVYPVQRRKRHQSKRSAVGIAIPNPKLVLRGLDVRYSFSAQNISSSDVYVHVRTVFLSSNTAFPSSEQHAPDSQPVRNKEVRQKFVQSAASSVSGCLFTSDQLTGPADPWPVTLSPP